MDPSEQVDFENAALAVELSRQLIHDFSNFAYNVSLQIQISQKSSAPVTANWDRIKLDYQKIVRLVRQWEHSQNRCAEEVATRLDLHQVIKEVACVGVHAPVALALSSSISSEPLWLNGGIRSLRLLLRLVLELEIHHQAKSNGTNARMEIRTEQTDSKAVIHIATVDGSENTPLWVGDWESAPEDVRSTWLLEASCRSLAIRLDVSIGRYRTADGQTVTFVGIPLDT